VAGTAASAAISGTYTLSSNGYGGATIASASAQLSGTQGVYAVDPALNILDPNNTSGGGGALLQNLTTGGGVGGGVLIPQATGGSTFSGSYAVDWRCFTPGGVEQNLDGQVNVATGDVIAGTADAADLQTGSPHLGVALSGTATVDPDHPWRFTLPLTAAFTPTSPALNLVLYQISSGNLVWIEVDTAQYVSGTIQQQ
jgi:hypothetical protein